jgi:hypothetical protein
LIIIIIIIEYSFFLLVSKLANYFGKGSKYWKQLETLYTKFKIRVIYPCPDGFMK